MIGKKSIFTIFGLLTFIIAILLPFGIVSYSELLCGMLNSCPPRECESCQAIVRDRLKSNGTCHVYLNVISKDKFYLTEHNCSEQIHDVINVWAYSCGFSKQNFQKISLQETFVDVIYEERFRLFFLSCAIFGLFFLVWIIVMIIIGMLLGIIKENENVNSGSMKRSRSKILLSSDKVKSDNPDKRKSE